MRIALTIFDMAGTTVQDDGHVLRTFLATCEVFGVQTTPQQINSMMGQSKSHVFRTLGMDADVCEQYFNRLLLDSYTQSPPQPIDGAIDAMRTLRSRGCKVALNTGFHHVIGNCIVDMLGWRNEIDAIVCGDEVSAGRPAPYMIWRTCERLRHHGIRSVAVVDDTKSGVLAGRNSGAISIGVLTGTDDDFPAADMVTDSVADVPILLGWS